MSLQKISEKPVSQIITAKESLNLAYRAICEEHIFKRESTQEKTNESRESSKIVHSKTSPPIKDVYDILPNLHQQYVDEAFDNEKTIQRKRGVLVETYGTTIPTNSSAHLKIT